MGLGRKHDGIDEGEVKLPALGRRSGTYVGPAVTPASPRFPVSGTSSTSSMYARGAKRSNDVLWLTGTQPTYILGNDNSPHRDGKRPPIPGTAKSEPPPVVSSPNFQGDTRTRSSQPRGRYIET